MRVANLVMTAAIVAGFSGAAGAQTPAPATPYPVPPPPAGSTAPHYIGTTVSHWTATGFVGASFNSSNDSLFTDTSGSSVDFGGEIAYLWRGVVGPEFLANYSPSFKMNNPLLTDDPKVLSYMFNAIGALPLGAGGHFTPYVSGGYGGVTARADVLGLSFPLTGLTPFLLDDDTALGLNTTSSTETKWGPNIGAGLMVFAGHVGVRGDVRYFRTPTLNSFSSSTPAGQFTETLVSGLRYWKANVGLAFMW